MTPISPRAFLTKAKTRLVPTEILVRYLSTFTPEQLNKVITSMEDYVTKAEKSIEKAKARIERAKVVVANNELNYKRIMEQLESVPTRRVTELDDDGNAVVISFKYHVNEYILDEPHYRLLDRYNRNQAVIEEQQCYIRSCELEIENYTGLLKKAKELYNKNEVTLILQEEFN